MKYKSDVLQELSERGFLFQCTNFNELDSILNKTKISAYIGFDVTADSLHVGHLTQIALLRILQKHGHRPIILLGGGTTKIGDPTGKDEIRQMFSQEILDKNILGISKSFKKFLQFSGSNAAVIVNNNDWLKDLNYIDFLRNFGIHFSVNKMLAMDTFKQRLEKNTNLSFVEFNYPLLQSFDFLQLYDTHKCILQLGGSDQWGNIVNGVELIRRTKGIEVFGITAPLLTTASGQKMGKSMSGAVWLNEDKLSPYNYWQYWRNTHDNDVIKFTKLFTNADQKLIDEFATYKFEDLNNVKIFLANYVTQLCHGEENLEEVKRILAGEASSNEYLTSFPLKEIHQKTVLELVLLSNLCSSNSQIKKLIANGGLYINEQRITDPKMLINDTHINNSQIKITLGKKRLVIIKLI